MLCLLCGRPDFIEFTYESVVGNCTYCTGFLAWTRSCQAIDTMLFINYGWHRFALKCHLIGHLLNNSA